MLLENLTWPEVKRLNVANKIVLLPLASARIHVGRSGIRLSAGREIL